MKPLLFAVLLCLSGTAIADELHLCARKRTGALRIDDSCKKNERPITVNSTGLPGPKGEPGMQGIPGTSVYPQINPSDIYGKWFFYFAKDGTALNCEIKIYQTVSGGCSSYFIYPLDPAGTIEPENGQRHEKPIAEYSRIEHSKDNGFLMLLDFSENAINGTTITQVLTGHIYAEISLNRNRESIAGIFKDGKEGYGTVSAIKVSD